MITVTKDPTYASHKPGLELVGLSTDEKPTDTVNGVPVTNGSTFIEMDTGNLYWFDQAAGEWIR